MEDQVCENFRFDFLISTRPSYQAASLGKVLPSLLCKVLLAAPRGVGLHLATMRAQKGRLFHSISRPLSLPTASPKPAPSRRPAFRQTDLWRKRNAQWKVVNAHVSVPADMKTGKADM